MKLRALPIAMFIMVLIVAAPLLAACSVIPISVRSTSETVPVEEESASMPNPASVFCEEQGGTVDIRTAEDGGQVGICVFPDGSECDEWAFYRGECAPSGAEAPAGSESVGLPNPASVYCEDHGGTLDIRTDADGGQVGICVFSDGSECEEWAFFRGECAPVSPPTTESYIPDEAALAASQYDSWQTYKNAAYGFEIRFPTDWSVAEITDSEDTMYQHRVSFSPPDDPLTVLYIAFKGVSEDRQITPTGIGAGDLVPRGSIPFLGEPLARQALVAEGKDMNVLYGSGEVTRSSLVFWVALNYAGSPLTDPGLSATVEALADQIVASTQVAP